MLLGWPRTMSERVGVYFPHFHIQDESFLKRSLLLWDRIAVIVPLGVPESEYSDSTLQLLQQYRSGDVHRVDADQLENSARVAIAELDDETYRALPEAEPIALHRGKLSDSLVRELADRAIRIERDGSYYRVDGRIAGVIMAALAQALSSDHTDAITDDPSLARISVSGVRAQDRDDVLERDLAIMLPNLDEVPLRSWLEFRARHRDDLAPYRRWVAEAARNVRVVVHDVETRSVLRDRRDELEELNQRGIGLSERFRLPFSFQILSVLAGVASPHWGGAVSAAAGALGMLASRMEKPIPPHVAFLHAAHRRFV
jgi:hypothetical protein